MHGITGSLGWALAPAVLVPIALAFSWRVALASAGVLVLSCWSCWWLNRPACGSRRRARPGATSRRAAGVRGDGSFGFLRIPAVWMCFGFFFLYAVVLGGVQAFAPEAARQLHDVPVRWAAMCLTFYMVASAGGMVIGGFLAADPARCEKIVGFGFGVAAALALTLGFAPLAPMAVPALFALMGSPRGWPGRRATSSSSAPHPTARPVASTASSTPASTSARRSRRWCSAR